MTSPHTTGILQWLAAARPHATPVRRREFWITQALVIAVATTLYVSHEFAEPLEARDDLIGTLATVHDGISALSIVPIVYAAITFGMEGAILTSLWIAFLLAPHTLLPLSSNDQWLRDLGIGIGALSAALLLAGRIQSERQARVRAEAMSARLRLLHELGRSLRRARPLDDLLQSFVETLREGMDLAYVGLRFREETDDPPLQVESGDATLAAMLGTYGMAGTSTPGDPSGHLSPTGDTAVLPLAGEHLSFGVLGVVARDRFLHADEREMLAIASLEASISLEVIRIEGMRREALARYARQVTNAQEEERARIARELHDGVVQTLTGMVRAIDLVTEEARRGGGVNSDGFERVRDIASDALGDLRRVTRDLRPLTLDHLGLLAAIRSQATQLADRTGIAVEMQFGDPRPLSPESELCIFRIVQEALSNVEKHSGASRVEVEVGFHDLEVHVEVRDDGRGYAPPEDANELARHGRFGILGMTERASLVAGSLDVTRRDGGGTKVALRVPLREREPSAPSISASPLTA